MAVFSSSAPIRCYIAPQTTLRTIPSSPAWQWAPHISIDMPTASELVQPTFKIGSGGKLAGIPGRQGGAPVKGQFAFFMSGTALTPPGLDTMLQSIFANAPVTVSGSLVYGFAFTTKPFLISVYNRIDAGSTNRLSWGNVPTRATLNLGGSGYFMIDYEGQAGYTLISDKFSTETTIAKAGLSAFPAEPTATSTGNIILPYNGSATFGGAATAEFISAQLEIVTGSASRNDGFADAYTFATFPRHPYRDAEVSQMHRLDRRGSRDDQERIGQQGSDGRDPRAERLRRGLHRNSHHQGRAIRQRPLERQRQLARRGLRRFDRFGIYLHGG